VRPIVPTDWTSAKAEGSVKHSAGVGATLRLGGIVFAQVYYAFGGSEGTRFNFTGNSNPTVVDSAARSVF